VHYPICLRAPLVPIGCAKTSYHLPITYSSLTHSLPSITIQFPHLVCFLIPIVLLIACILDHISLTSHFPMTHIFHLHHAFLLLWFSTILSFVSSLHSDSDPDLDIYINPWETPLCLLSLTWLLIQVFVLLILLLLCVLKATSKTNPKCATACHSSLAPHLSHSTRHTFLWPLRLALALRGWSSGYQLCSLVATIPPLSAHISKGP